LDWWMPQGGIHQILKNIDRNGIGTINIKILSINCIFAVDSNNFHTTVVVIIVFFRNLYFTSYIV